jgi:hypothetical protein
MMHNLRRSERDDTGTGCIQNGELPAVIDRLPEYVQEEISTSVRAEAIKRRDAAFAHWSK